MLETLRQILSDPMTLGIWGVLVLASLAVVLRDLFTANAQTMPLMKLVWALTVAYSGPFGLLVYWKTGRRQIATDSVWRRGWRSTAHCYSGCGLGEIVGLVLAVGVIGMGTAATALTTFAFAYLFGFALTFGPLVQGGVAAGTAARDAVASETASITVMEVVAIGTDLWLAGPATIGQALFWASMAVSLSLGLLAAWPVNVALIRMGVKEGMHDPRESHDHGHGACA